ncbi:MBL fold metallo-hydrolase [Nocardioides sp. Kera G14]|uniref:MBL fold metallo-hydrolase n=1 Tax=Nocardioides sp. Kera G14 TaxID=2884264 RepID=UPI001D1202EA|nr:MBL fold metallo-hydrolase [Nocardioides sp. Kera G14]UDY23749.1 MBL fold metallo-hydrolase [Nocardioides sp. Kera G14]
MSGEAWTGGSYGDHECVLAPNPGLMTLDGTNTWILRAGTRSVVVDPGPLSDSHLDAVAEAAGDVVEVLLTHHHFDHSESARAFGERVGAPVRALDPALVLGAEGLRAGDVVSVGSELEIEVVATPGHTADSLSFWVPSASAVLTGDTVLGRGTTVVAHPDGQLGAYLSSLDRLRALAESRDVSWIWPGHGPAIADALATLDYYIAHRHSRLEQVATALVLVPPDTLPDDVPRAVVEIVYADVDPVLWGAAELSVRAQLAHLDESRPS